MAKPRYLYHGSGRELEGKRLIPKKAKDLGNVRDNSLLGIYASDYIIEAIAMGILKLPGIKGGSIDRGKPEGIPAIDAVMYGGKPKQSYFYLYSLPSKTFKNIPKGSNQWISLKPVKPLKVEKLPVKDYIHLIRKATKKEKEEYNKFRDK
jgi:hypothetical protein